jgi:hypothetical protein
LPLFANICVSKEQIRSEDSTIGGQSIMYGIVKTTNALGILLCDAGPIDGDLMKGDLLSLL